MDPRGYRRSKESFEGWTSEFYWRHSRLSASYYVFGLLVIRGVFVASPSPGLPPPLLRIPAGTVLQIRPECQNYFLFCRDDGSGGWLDCVPSSAQSVSNVTRIITRRMSPLSGQKARSSRAHRVAAGTNPQQRALLRSGGKRVDEGTLGASSRWGAWSGRQGIQTIVNCYER
jgi:hypothetical protein